MDNKLNSNEILYRCLIEDCKQLLGFSGSDGRESPPPLPPPPPPPPPTPRCWCPPTTKTDRSGRGLVSGTAAATRSCQPRARPPPPLILQKKTSTTRRCECSRATCGDRDHGPSACTDRRPTTCRPPSSSPSFWSTVACWARATACCMWAQKSYFFVAVASFALGLYADDYCQCIYESD